MLAFPGCGIADIALVYGISCPCAPAGNEVFIIELDDLVEADGIAVGSVVRRIVLVCGDLP